MPFKWKSNGRPPRLPRFRGCFRGHRGQNFKIIYFLSLFIIEFSSFWVSRSFDLGDLGVLEKSPVNIFNNYIFEISLFHWSKCTIECAIRLTSILKSTQARCGKVFLQERMFVTKSSVIVIWKEKKQLVSSLFFFWITTILLVCTLLFATHILDLS